MVSGANQSHRPGRYMAWNRVRCQSARLHTWIYMVLYHGDHVTSSTGYTIQKCILQLVIITAQIVEIAGFVILKKRESSQYQPFLPIQFNTTDFYH